MGKLRLVGLVAGGAALALAGTDAAMAQQSIGDMARDGAADLAEIPAFLEVLMYIAGAVCIFAGIVKFKQVSSAGRDQRLGGAITTVLVGVALIALPSVYQGIADTFGVDDTATIERPSLE